MRMWQFGPGLFQVDLHCQDQSGPHMQSDCVAAADILVRCQSLGLTLTKHAHTKCDTWLGAGTLEPGKANLHKPACLGAGVGA